MRKIMILALMLFSILFAQLTLAQYWQDNQYLKPYNYDAYGPGVHSDSTGRPFIYEPYDHRGGSYPDPTLRIYPDHYGPGIDSDQYGRPLRKRNW